VVTTPQSEKIMNLKWFTGYAENVVFLYKRDGQEVSATADCYTNSDPNSNHYANANRECKLTLIDLTPGSIYMYKFREGDNVEDNYTSYFVMPIKSNAVNVADISDSSVKINWISEKNQISRVLYYSKSNEAEQKEVNNYDFVKLHSLKIINLIPSTTYIYKVISTDQEGAGTISDPLEFTTLSNNSSKLELIKIEVKNINSTIASFNWSTNLSADSMLWVWEGEGKKFGEEPRFLRSF
jgi:hypothetical protein